MKLKKKMKKNTKNDNIFDKFRLCSLVCQTRDLDHRLN